jgi:Cupredoxin-like domain
MNKLTALVLLLTSIFVTSCKEEASNIATSSTPKSQISESVVDPQFSTKIEFLTSPKEVKTNEQTELSFTVKNSAGETVKDLKIVHEKPMHLLVVSGDLNEFHHLHPEKQTDGSFKVPFAFPNGGKYKLFVDMTLADNNQVIRSVDLNVTGEIPTSEKLIADKEFENSLGGISVTMKPDGDIVAGKEILFGFSVNDIATKKPTTDLQNYLGEKAHFVVISEDLVEFVHAHPMSSDAVKSNHSEHSHTEKTENKLTANAETVISAHVTFPKAGLYKLWAQFQRNGRVIDVPFVIDVKENKETPQKSANVEIPKDAFQITVSKDGFIPSEISFAAGKFSKLAFLRIDSENCADEITFKDLNIKKKLPVGEVVLVDLPNSLKGKTISFACGMNMFKGNLILE